MPRATIGRLERFTKISALFPQSMFLQQKHNDGENRDRVSVQLAPVTCSCPPKHLPHQGEFAAYLKTAKRLSVVLLGKQRHANATCLSERD